MNPKVGSPAFEIDSDGKATATTTEAPKKEAEAPKKDAPKETAAPKAEVKKEEPKAAPKTESKKYEKFVMIKQKLHLPLLKSSVETELKEE